MEDSILEIPLNEAKP
jgi:hypothetical protein